MKSLTPRQSEVLAVITRSIAATGRAPTIEELKLVTGIVSNRGVTVHLDALAKKGVIIRSKNKTRGIVLAECPQ